jgi:hypothetical protein
LELVSKHPSLLAQEGMDFAILAQEEITKKKLLTVRSTGLNQGLHDLERAGGILVVFLGW